jgi:DNA polymerase-3 subunit delta'
MNTAAAGLPPPPWLAAQTASLSAAFRAGRMPHALLLHEAPGAGGDWLALWLAQLVLCQERSRAPCGECSACRRVAARAHPDLAWLGLEEESRQIRIEQVRELSAELALTSHAGGFKVGVISPADTLNRFAANASLKTLEEPPAGTLLILVATQPSRLPPTVLSRCQRLYLRAPARREALGWLERARGPGEWAAALDVLGEAPFLALEANLGELASVAPESRTALEALASGSADPVATAERWARSELPLRLLCFEKWLTERIRRVQAPGAFLTDLRPGAYLPEPSPFLNIRALFGMVDEVRELRASLDVPLNRGLALEVLFRRLAPAARSSGA